MVCSVCCGEEEVLNNILTYSLYVYITLIRSLLLYWMVRRNSRGEKRAFLKFQNQKVDLWLLVGIILLIRV